MSLWGAGGGGVAIPKPGKCSPIHQLHPRRGEGLAIQQGYSQTKGQGPLYRVSSLTASKTSLSSPIGLIRKASEPARLFK